jgi:hypothetical protein
MDHQNTIPSVLGPMSGPDDLSARRETRGGRAQGGGLLKVVFWAAAGLLVLALLSRFLR